MRKSSLSMLAVGAAAALALAGCSGGDSGSGSGDTVKVAFLGSLSGAAGSTGPTTKAVVEAWAKDVNARGGLDGHQVELTAKDTAGPTGTNINAAKEVIANGADVILDLDTSDIQWVSLAEQAKIPVIGASSVAPLISTNVFPIINSSNAQLFSVVSAAKEFGPEAAVGYAAEVPIAAQYATLTETLGKEVGVSVVQSTKLSSSQPDYTAFCQGLKSSGAESYLLSLSTPIAQKVTDQCYQQGVKLPQVLYGGQTPRSWLADPAYNGSVAQDIVAPFFDTSVPGVATYREALKKYLPSLPDSADDSSGGTVGWALGKMLEYGVEHGGGTSSEDIKKGLYTAKDETLDGLIAPVTYTEGETTHVTCSFLWKIENGKYALTDAGAKPFCPVSDELVTKYDDQLAQSLRS